MLCTAKGTAALQVPVSRIIASHFGWQAVFHIAACFNAVSAILTLFVLKPLRASFLEDGEPEGTFTRASPDTECL
jgi:OFA family oxalate/formate antiporter-like MFS transporter